MQTATAQAVDVAVQEAPTGAVPMLYEEPSSTAALVLDNTSMERMIRVAEFMSSAKATLPNEYRNNPGDCLAVVMQAVQWGMNPYAVAQKTFFISGKIGYEAQLVHAAIQASGILTDDGFEYEWYGPWEKVIGKYIEKTNQKGDTYRKLATTLDDEKGVGIKIRGTFRKTGTVRELDLLLTQAGTRNSTLWADDPRQQLAYLAEKRWARLYAPHVILGVNTRDELEQVTERDITSESEVVQQASSKDKLRAAATGGDPPAVTLDQVLKAISAAQNNIDLTAAAEQALKLANEDEKTKARAAYAERMATLKRAAATPDPKTGEIAGSNASDGEPITYAGVEAQMRAAVKAKSKQALDDAASLIHSPGIPLNQQKELSEAYKAMAKELEGLF